LITYVGPGGTGGFRGWLARVGHHQWRLYVPLVCLNACPVPATGPLSWLPVVPLGGLLLWVAATSAHELALCETCISDFPLDAQAQAERKIRLLRLSHWSRTGRGTMVWVAVLAAAVLIPSVVWHGWRWWPTLMLASIPWMVNENASLTHKRLRPVCPICRGRDGGGGRDVPVVDPDPVDSTPRTPAPAA